MDEILLAKAEIMERCLARIAEEYTGHEHELATNFTRQDAILLNLQRAIQAAIDAAMHEVRRRRLGLPKTSREAFALLARAGRLPHALAERMQAMVGFRNILVHEYQKLSLDALRHAIEHGAEDLRAFAAMLIMWSKEER